MNREYNCKVSSKNSKRLVKNFQNTTGDYFFAAPCTSLTDLVINSDLSTPPRGCTPPVKLAHTLC